MTNRQITAKKSKDGELSVQHNETDSPVIPVAAMERLHGFKPEAVDWVIQQTQAEAEFRRNETKTINKFVFIEHLLGQIFALLIGLAGVVGGCYTAIQGQPWAGGLIATASLTGLAVVFLTGQNKPK